MTTKENIRLITIPMSHYCEKARWALERLGIAYCEERHLQVFHYPRTFWVSRGPNVPVLIDKQQVISDSSAILKHLDRYATPDRRLYPDDPEECSRVEQMEDLFDDVLGVESRRWIYFQFRNHFISAARTAGQGAPLVEKLLMPLITPLFMVIIHKLLNPTTETVATGVEKMRNIVRKTDAMLADNGPFLLGPRFTAADLSLACMMSPLLLPPNYGIRLPEPEEMPASAQGIIREFRGTRTGNYVLELFETERCLT